MTSFYFWGVVEGEDADEVWKTLHDHFEKLAREDDDSEIQVTERKAVNKSDRIKRT